MINRYLLAVTSLAFCLSGCFLADDDPMKPSDCSIVHETFPNVGQDSCSWVLNVMENYAPPTILPPATDTGGQLLAARILTDTGVIAFVAGGIPALPFSFATPCSWWRVDQGEDNQILFQGSYCYRPPIDNRTMLLRLIFNSDGTLKKDADNSYLTFKIKDGTSSFIDFAVTDTSSINVSSVINYSSRVISGTFSATLYNEDQPSETIQILDGRFDSFF